MEIILVTTTVETLDDARNIGRALLEKRLMACAQVSGPITSIYRWQGKVVDGQEYLLTVKTSVALQQEVVAAIKKMHPYEVPEIVVQKPEYTEPDYAKWVNGEVMQ